DDLTLSYQGNQLIKVEDAAPTFAVSESTDFKNGVNQAIEYTYDKNGNLTKDLNKGISIISYNSLNLPVSLSIANNSGSATNRYTYSADGRKLKVEMKYGANQTKTTDYVGNVIDENGSLKRILVDGGYIENGKYYYYIQDHLGNNRVVAQADGSVLQSNHYYPFGMMFTENNTGDSKAQPYKYNGKEFDGERGLNVYDYSARYMDLALGRFMTVDPLAEKYYGVSPYAYCMNNPLRYTDPGGDSVRVYTETQAAGHSWISTGEGENMVVYSYGRYNGTNKGPDGSSNSLANGAGVLLRLTGDDAKAYNEEKAAMGMSVFVVADVADESVATAMDEKFNSSTVTPDKGKYKENPSAHVIDEYSLTSNNCTTVVSDVLNNSGSNALKGTTLQQTSSFGTFMTVPVTNRFVLPASMQNYLIKMSRPSGTIYRIR
ncbi:MAG: RHS repeat-associated core domain-containing protein, partial [Bacteroidia bacterium]|nr:RHS repeat-associated core domain-containing protein [Bacteroidia bacterium]